ncbi:TIGR01777 family oxidoreductase [Akkermansiaceae bacterium]|nr:TIGR01777 family oxidoreductase [Akkermansiaceae bacterium]MDB4387431.1 TIGR01777 family oxidoreductase [Akkermansiaceae bacterium]MDB4412601.1 TIGR01777 family oxidoreductase [bacterium]
MAKTIGIIGASGWLGQHLSSALLEKGHRVIGFSRSSRNDDAIIWRRWKDEPDFSDLDAVVNLAGESIDQRWSDSKKKKFYESRVVVTENVVKAMASHGVSHLLNASAVGIYGDQGGGKIAEDAPVGNNYLAELCLAWEKAAEDAPKVTFLRTGVVLGKGGGAWEKMSKIFKLGIGGKLGSGKQWMPWIHLADEIESIVFCLEKEIEGPVNLVALQSVTNAEFTKVAGAILRRPTIFAAPAFALKLALGDFAEEGLLASQRVVPQVLKAHGFGFQFPEIQTALKSLLSNQP